MVTGTHKIVPIKGGLGRKAGEIAELCSAGKDYLGRQRWDAYHHGIGDYIATLPAFPHPDRARVQLVVDNANARHAASVEAA